VVARRGGGSGVDERLRYLRQRTLQGVGEEGQELFFATEVVCAGQSPLLQTAAAYLEAAGFCLAGHRVFSRAGFWPLSWEGAAREGGILGAKPRCRQRGFLGQLPCPCPEGFDFWVVMGCFRGEPGFVFARGGEAVFLREQLRGGTALEGVFSPDHWPIAAWSALVFERLSLGFPPGAGGGSIGCWGEVELWGGG